MKNFRVSDGTSLLVSGWGRLKESGSPSEQLQKVYVPVVSNEVCALSYEDIRNDQICAGVAGKDSCQVFLLKINLVFY